MPYSLFATLVVAGHLAFIAFVVGGGLLVRRWPRLLWLHLPCAVWAVYVEWNGRICPLTPLENWLRQRAGEAGYAETFIDHYLLAIVYPEGLTSGIQAAAALLVAGVNALVYAWLWRRRAR